MNLLQGILGAVGAMQGGQQPAGNPMLNAVLGMLSNSGPGTVNPGGLGGLLSMFQNAGLGNVIQSWIGTGQNLPINADQLQQVLGSDTLEQLARQMGLSPQDASGQLSQLLPQIVDALTPQGQAPQGGFGDMGSMLSMLQKAMSR